MSATVEDEADEEDDEVEDEEPEDEDADLPEQPARPAKVKHTHAPAAIVLLIKLFLRNFFIFKSPRMILSNAIL